MGEWERGWDSLQIGERLLLLPTGGGVGEVMGIMGSPADWRETTAVPHGWGVGEEVGYWRETTAPPHGWGSGRGGGIAGRLERD